MLIGGLKGISNNVWNLWFLIAPSSIICSNLPKQPPIHMPCPKLMDRMNGALQVWYVTVPCSWQPLMVHVCTTVGDNSPLSWVDGV